MPLASLALLSATIAGVALALLSFLPAPPAYIWNFTASAPIGLYRLEDRVWGRGDMIVVRPTRRQHELLARLGARNPQRLLLKTVAGLPGDTVCRDAELISLNGRYSALAKPAASDGAPLPVWSGCEEIQTGDLFLLSDHPASLDSRYFGAFSKSSVIGAAHPVATWRPDPGHPS